MKKLMFTAIALVAFSGVSMANTIADEEVKKDNEVKKEVVIQMKADPCQNVCHLAYDLAISEGASHATADAYGDLVYANCIASQKTISAN